MYYIKELIRYANKFDRDISVDIKGDIFKVYIQAVALKDGYARPRVFGQGTTIEDACCDFIRRARGSKLVNLTTDEEIEIL